VEPMLCRAARRGNSETKRICAVWKLTERTGRREEAVVRAKAGCHDFRIIATNKTTAGV